MKIKKSAICMIVLAFTSLILITGSPFQIATNLVENNGHLNYKNIGQEAYAADDDGGGGDGGGGDSGGDDGGDEGGDGGDSGDAGEGGDSDSSDDASEDSPSIGENYDDGSGSSGSEGATSTSNDDFNNDGGESDDGGIESPAPDFFSASDEPTSTPPVDGSSNDDGDGVDISAFEFFGDSDGSTSASEDNQPNLQTLFNPLKEPTSDIQSSSGETDAVEQQEDRGKVIEAPTETSFSNPEGAVIAPISNPNGEIKNWGNTVGEYRSRFEKDYDWDELKDSGMSKYAVDDEAFYASEDFKNKVLEK